MLLPHCKLNTETAIQYHHLSNNSKLMNPTLLFFAQLTYANFGTLFMCPCCQESLWLFTVTYRDMLGNSNPEKGVINNMIYWDCLLAVFKKSPRSPSKKSCTRWMAWCQTPTHIHTNTKSLLLSLATKTCRQRWRPDQRGWMFIFSDQSKGRGRGRGSMVSAQKISKFTALILIHLIGIP